MNTACELLARALPAEVNGFWTNKSFHNYADYALSEDFHAGLERLIEAGSIPKQVREQAGLQERLARAQDGFTGCLSDSNIGNVSIL